MSGNIRPRRVGAMRTKDDLNKRLLWVDEDVSKEQIIRMSGLFSEGAYHTCALAIADGTQSDMELLVAWHAVDYSNDKRREVLASKHYLIEDVDTSAATIGDLVYLSDTTPGAWTLSPTMEPIGFVQEVSTAGRIWIDPDGARLSAVTANAQKSRPDWDSDWESTISGADGGDGDNKVYVNNSTGNDSTADGTPDKPYATIDAAILDIPHNRDLTALRNVTIVVANTGTHYDISTHLEATSQITLLCDAPTPTESGAVTNVYSTTTAETMVFDTDLAFGTKDDYQGWLIQYESGKWGWISSSANDGSGFDQMVATQAVNGAAYDTMVPTDTFEVYDPSDLVELRITNTGGNGLNIDQCDNFKIRRANITSSGTNGKVVCYQSRVTLQDCYFGSTIGRLFVNNGSLLVSNCYLACDGEATFGQVGISGGGVLQLRGGTSFDGTAAVDATPFTASGSRVVVSGPVLFRGSTAAILKNGAEIDYSDGYSAEVSTFWYGMTGTEPHYRIDEYDGGTPVRGVIPDIHGPNRDIGTIIVYANAPCQLWVGRGTDIGVTGKSAGTYVFTLTDGADYTSYNAYDGSFIRMDRERSFSTQGVNWGPHLVTVTGTNPNLPIDWSRGPSQVYDLTGATASTTVTWTFPDNGELGAVAILEIVQGTTLTHSWSGSYIWAGGTPPVLSTGNGERDILQFYYTGTEWIGSVFALNVS